MPKFVTCYTSTPNLAPSWYMSNLAPKEHYIGVWFSDPSVKFGIDALIWYCIGDTLMIGNEFCFQSWAADEPVETNSKYYVPNEKIRFWVAILLFWYNLLSFKLGSEQGRISEADVREADLDFSIHACGSSSSRSNCRWCREGILLRSKLSLMTSF